MDLTIITCVHNGYKFIESYWQGILKIQHLVKEVIVVNDGSNDQTLDALKKINSEKLTIISISNCGPSAARNYGLRFAHTAYILFLDIDDILIPRGLELNLNFLKTNPHLDFVVGFTVYTKTSGVSSITYKLNSLIRKIRLLSINKNAAKHIFNNNFIVTPGCVIFKLSFILKHQFDSKLKLGEDWELFTRILHFGKYRLTFRNILNYRISATSLSFTETNKHQSFEQLFSVLSSNFTKLYPEYNISTYKNSLRLNFELFKAKQLSNRHTFSEILALHSRLTKEYPENYFKIIINLIKVWHLKLHSTFN